MRLIRLHEDGDKAEITINVNYIVSFKEFKYSSNAIIMLTTGDIICVQETVDQLVDKLKSAQKYQTLII